MKNEKTKLFGENVLKELSLHRSVILDAVERDIGEAARWPQLRKRLLTSLGDRGIEGSIRTFINQLNH